jgi:hypothetical protein
MDQPHSTQIGDNPCGLVRASLDPFQIHRHECPPGRPAASSSAPRPAKTHRGRPSPPGQFHRAALACDSSLQGSHRPHIQAPLHWRTSRNDELRQDVQLIEQLSVELPPSLIRRKSAVPPGGHHQQHPNQPTLPAATRFRTTGAENSRSRRWHRHPDPRAGVSFRQRDRR